MPMLAKPMDVLNEKPPDSSPSRAFFAARTLLTAPMWRAVLWGVDKGGRFVRWIAVDLRPVFIVLLALGAVFLRTRNLDWEAFSAGGACALLALVPSFARARGRVMVGDFDCPPLALRSEGKKAPVDLGNLIQTELSRLGSLFRVVEDRRAVSSGLVASAAVDATISVDEVVGALQDTVSAETKVSAGPFSLPVAPLMALASRAFRAPRLTGSLHRDEDTLILTARQRGHSGLSWRVTPSADEPSANGDIAPPESEAEERPELSAMVRELALRIFTDLALGRDVRWEASNHFVQGLERFRAALRTPKDRKVNLKRVELEFLDALSEDEDFPVAYYNLGVVYTELHGLAVTGGRFQEEAMHLSAAETSFKWAIEKEPRRWDAYLALAQTQFGNQDYAAVVKHCERILKLRRWDLSARARARDLQARAYVRRGDVEKAVTAARKGMHGALAALILARLFRRSPPDDEGDRVPRSVELAGACTATFALCYSKWMTAGADESAVSRRVRSLIGRSEMLLQSSSDVHFEFGLRAMSRGNLAVAGRELELAVSSDPKRSAYTAAWALLTLRKAGARAPGGTLPEADVVEVEQLCDEAVEGMSGVFAPARDLDACDLVIEVYQELAGAAASPRAAHKAAGLKQAKATVCKRLETPASEGSVSAFFLEAIEDVGWKGALGGYGMAMREARRRLKSQPRTAVTFAERATSLNPLSSLAWETLGDVHGELQDFQSARDAWKYARSRDPDNPRLYDKIGSSYWQIAFRLGHSRVDREELEHAEGYFRSALLLYGSGNLVEQALTRYRLGKLYIALGDFARAWRQLKIVEAVSDRPPLVGWQLLAQAYLGQRNFAECENYFRLVITGAGTLEAQNVGPEELIGHDIDERYWPLGLIRAWGHLGLALSYTERDGSLSDARVQLARARRHAALVKDRERFPTRIDAACTDCDGFIRQRQHDPGDAIEKFKKAIGKFPYSRSYMHLVAATIELARAKSATPDDLEDAERALAHATSLRPSDLPTDEIDHLREELAAVAG